MCRTRAAGRRSTRSFRTRCRWCPRSSRSARASSMPAISACWRSGAPASFPHAPTLQETGYPEVIYILWAGVFAPRKTPSHVTRILREAIRPFMQDKAVVERFMKAGSQVSYMDGPEFERFLDSDTDRLLKVVRKIGLS